MRGTSYWDDLKHLQSSKIGQATRSRRPGSPTATRLWPREGGLQNTKRPTLTLRGPADTGRLSEGQKVKQGRLCRHFFTCFSGNFPPSGACLRIYENRSRRPNRSTNRTPNRELKSHGLSRPQGRHKRNQPNAGSLQEYFNPTPVLPDSPFIKHKTGNPNRNREIRDKKKGKRENELKILIGHDGHRR